MKAGQHKRTFCSYRKLLNSSKSYILFIHKNKSQDITIPETKGDVFINELLVEYDDVMIRKRAAFSDAFFPKESVVAANNALRVMRYSFTRYLRWSQDAVREKMTTALMEKLHLLELMKYIDYPVEYDKCKDYFYLVSLVFKSAKLTLRDKTVHTYERVLSGEQVKYPKDYFLGSDGYVKAGICLQYMINHYVAFSSFNELYSIFSTEEGYEYLQKYKLINAYKEIFDTPVDFLHFALPKHQKNTFYLNYYRFKFLREMLNENGRKQKSLKNYRLEGNLP